MNKSLTALRGVVPPLVSPFSGRDALDREGLERLVEHVIGGGVQGLFLLGSTGEGPGLSGRLRRELVTHACRVAGGRVPILVGVSDTSFEESLALARHAADCGADAVVATTPYYFPPGQGELIDYFTSLSDELPLPLYLYNMPGLTGTVIDPPTVRRLMDQPGIAGIKDSSGDLEYFGSLLAMARERDGWSVFMGREELGMDAVRQGAHGVVPGGANVAPRLHADAWAAVVAGDRDRADAGQAGILRLADAVFTLGCPGAGFIQGLKCALSLMGICGDRLAPPFRALDDAARAELKSRLAAIGVPLAAGPVGRP